MPPDEECPASPRRGPLSASPFFILFATPLGECALVWRDEYLLGVFLPEGDPVATRRAVLRGFPSAEDGDATRVERVVSRIVKLLTGTSDPLDDIPLSFENVTPFQKAVYEMARKIPPGETVSYGELARRVGRPSGARAVGVALGKNPFPLVVPCHRVLSANGKLGGFSAFGGLETKERLLTIERGAGR